MPVTKRIMTIRNTRDNLSSNTRKTNSDDNLNSHHHSNEGQSFKKSPRKIIEQRKTERKQILGSSSKEQVKIIVSRQDHTKMVAFIMKRDDQMQKLFKRYASIVGVQASSLRFLFDGNKINGVDTPRNIEIEDDNIIEVYQMESNGGKCYFKLLSSK